MLLREFFNSEQDSEKVRFDYDVVDDVHQFMINDPMFYRRTYYPAVSNMCSQHKKGVQIDPRSSLEPIILNACKQYVEKFQVNADSEKLLDEEEIELLACKIYDIETGAN